MSGATADGPPAADWDLPEAFTIEIEVQAADIDSYRHVNNAVYVRWLDQVAWAHSRHLGLSEDRYQALGRGMAVWRSQLHYIAPAVAGDRVAVATWLTRCDARLRVDRRFQIRRIRDDQDLLRALIHYVCIDLADGGPRRMPAEFATAFRPRASVVAALGRASRPFQPGVPSVD
jgi:acyl-CoA thioester hydrolase